MDTKIILKDDNAMDEWRKDKLTLSHRFYDTYGFYDYANDVFYKQLNKYEYIAIPESELDICTIKPAKGILCFIGNGSTKCFQHFSPASNGYPEYPWEDKHFEHVYILSSGVQLDDWTERFGFIDIRNKTKGFSIERDLTIKLKDLVDIQWHLESQAKSKELFLKMKANLLNKNKNWSSSL